MDERQFTSNGQVITHKEAIIRHVIRRSRQRFHLRIDGGDYKKINKKVVNGEGIVEKINHRVKIVRIPYRNRDMRCYFSLKLQCVVTLIPLSKVKQKRISFESSLRNMIQQKVNDDTFESLFSSESHEVRVSRKRNYVKIIKKSGEDSELVFQCGYPDNIKKIDETLICIRRKTLEA